MGLFDNSRPSSVTRRRLRLVLPLLILVLAGGLRLYRLQDVPAGLFCDEAAMGYNAFTLGAGGVDENGRPWPLYIWSFGVSYKNPAYIYPGIVPVKLLGLSEFSTRLPAALFGLGTVLGVFFLGRALLGPWVGAWAALFLAICPWHLHFSRIAFELISFPFLFVTGATFLVRYTQGRRTLPAAFFFFALCVYSYAPSALFVPVFVAGFGLLHVPMLLRRWRQTLLAVLVAAATVAPAATFHLRSPQAGTVYFSKTTWLRQDAAWQPQARTFARNYAEFFSPRFLFQSGDPLVRHAVKGEGRFGELLWFFAPFLLVGAAVLLVWPNRVTKLMLWWLAWYPVGAALMTEIPSATRSIIGVPAFCLLTGVGFAACLRALGWVLRWRPLALAGQAAAVAVAGYFLVPQVTTYLHEYFVEYPKYSAPTPGGFQYGFREAIDYMETQRGQYDIMLISTTDGNQNQVFPQFYRARDGVWGNNRDNIGYVILDPAEYRRYNPATQRVLYAIYPADLAYFTDYEMKKRVFAPGGHEVMDVVAVRRRKAYLTDWLVLGLFPNENNDGVEKNFIDVSNVQRGRYPGINGDVSWRLMRPQFVRADLNQHFATADPGHMGNPENACAYALQTIVAPSARNAYLHLSGTEDRAQVWLNGELLTPKAFALGAAPVRTELRLNKGNNVLVLKICESVGGWFFTARVLDADGAEAGDLVFQPDFPRREAPNPPAAQAPVSAVELVEGFDSIVRAPHTEARYDDFRGGSLSWIASVRDGDGEVVWKTAPVPHRSTTTFAFTASMGVEPGQAELWINNQYVLSFDLGAGAAVQKWQRGAYQWLFQKKNMAGGQSGVFLLTVPAEVVTPGSPLELRVTPVRGNENAWFMLKAHRDTVAHEGLTAQGVADTVRNSWQPGP